MCVCVIIFTRICDYVYALPSIYYMSAIERFCPYLKELGRFIDTVEERSREDTTERKNVVFSVKIMLDQSPMFYQAQMITSSTAQPRTTSVEIC